MPLFDIPARKNRDIDNTVLKSSATKKKATSSVKGGKSLVDRIASINDMVKRKLGHLINDTILITTEFDLHKYVDKCIEKGICAIDTETTGLDPLTDKIVGWSICTLDSKPAYIPINHESYITNVRCDNQLTEEITKCELDRLTESNVKIVMFNADFDIRVFRHTCNCYLTCYWDCYLGARVLNENEPVNRLKPLHAKYVLNGREDAFTFDDLFKGITFNLIPINTGYLYAAHDAKITLELYQFQSQYLYYDETKPFSDRNGMNGVSYAFFTIEMPVVEIVCDMEDNGIALDLDYSNELSTKYHEQLDNAEKDFYDELKTYQYDIDKYLAKYPLAKLDNPINIGSSSQLAILLYDILGIESPDKQNPRGTGVDILKKMEIPLAKKILKYREVAKLISTYIDKLPEVVNKKTGRLHCKFNSYGADTGRFSSSDPNLQNIPSKNHDIRKMFKATDDCVLMSSDFSQQEQLDYFKVSRWSDVETPTGFICANNLKVNDVLKVCENDVYSEIIVRKIEILVDSSQVLIYC